MNHTPHAEAMQDARSRGSWNVATGCGYVEQLQDNHQPFPRDPEPEARRVISEWLLTVDGTHLEALIEERTLDGLNALLSGRGPSTAVVVDEDGCPQAMASAQAIAEEHRTALGEAGHAVESVAAQAPPGFTDPVLRFRAADGRVGWVFWSYDSDLIFEDICSLCRGSGRLCTCEPWNSCGVRGNERETGRCVCAVPSAKLQAQLRDDPGDETPS